MTVLVGYQDMRINNNDIDLPWPYENIQACLTLRSMQVVRAIHMASIVNMNSCDLGEQQIQYAFGNSRKFCNENICHSEDLTVS